MSNFYSNWAEKPVFNFQHSKFKRIKLPQGGSYDVYDFALLRLDLPFRLGPVVRLVCLPFQNLPHIGSKLTVSGWGLVSTKAKQRPAKLRFVELTGNSAKDCAKKLAAKQALVDPEVILCAGWGEKKGTYDGDSGGEILLNLLKPTINLLVRNLQVYW